MTRSALRKRSNRGPSTRYGRPKYHRPVQESALSAWVLVPIVAIVGAFVASQFFTLNPRYIKLMAGALAVLAILRSSFPAAVTFFLLAFPVPTFVFVSDTNLLLIGLLLTVWVVNMTMGRLPRPLHSPVDWAIWIYIGIHVLSFINVDTPESLSRGVNSFLYLASGAVFFWLLYNGLRTQHHLYRAFVALCALSLFVNISAFVEHFFHYELVPEWFLYRAGQTRNDIRVGGIFGFHGLLADFNAIVFYLQIFMGMRAREKWLKVYYYGLAIFGLIVITWTVNRGGAIAWALGGGYFLFLMRRRIDWVKAIVAAPALIAVFFVNQWVSSFGAQRVMLFARIAGTQLERGVPDNRVRAWTQIMERIPEHLWIGHGPFYKLGGVGEAKIAYPHSAYLFYLYTTGILGLASWLWILVKLVLVTFPGFHVDFRRASFVKGAQALLHVQILMFAAAQVRDEHQRGNVYLYVMWILFGLGAVATRMVKEERARARADQDMDMDLDLDPEPEEGPADLGPPGRAWGRLAAPDRRLT
ncbi:MAG: O-antigen ligase family protein [Candidatus Eisenbacteria bacterium]